MEVITIPHIHIPSIDIGGICLPGIGVPDGGKKGLVWPKGLKESIKAIYDPALQGMTNYDVIEAYAEDFTKWGKKNDRATMTVTNKTINITNVAVPDNSVIEDNNVPFSDLVVKVTGVSEETNLIARHINKVILVMKTDGVYKIPSNDKYIAFGVSKTGDCNIIIEQLPTSILKDLSGNGNHAYLYGGKGNLNSGMGVYNYVFDNGRNVQDSILNKKYTVYINDTPVNGNLKFKVVTLNPNTIDFSFEIVEKDVDGKVLSYNGMKTPTDIVDFKPRDNTATIQLRIRYDSFATTGDIQLGIQLLPNAYPNQLCYDGKMYAVCYGFPILEDYTVMADRTWFNTEQGVCFLSKSANADGAFIMELREAGSHNAYQTYSFYGKNNINIALNKSGISYQTTRSYNGTDINMGSAKDTNTLFLGTIRKYDRRMFVGCHGKIIIADRSFTEDEITWLKDNWKKI